MKWTVACDARATVGAIPEARAKGARCPWQTTRVVCLKLQL
jgi:hypothetical protein